MPRNQTPDPYKDFKDDDQRRRALNFRESHKSFRVLVIAACGMTSCIVAGNMGYLPMLVKWVG
jgi:hypothetical protein